MIAATFALDGEKVVRRRRVRGCKRLVTGSPDKQGYLVTMVGKRRLLLHRIKFGLYHGWLPRLVDHRDLDKANNRLNNLRAATQAENMRNAPRRRQQGSMPRGVQRTRSGRYLAKAWTGRGFKCLGTFDTPQEASKVVEAFLREAHGEFYRTPNRTIKKRGRARL